MLTFAGLIGIEVCSSTQQQAVCVASLSTCLSRMHYYLPADVEFGGWMRADKRVTCKHAFWPTFFSSRLSFAQSTQTQWRQATIHTRQVHRRMGWRQTCNSTTAARRPRAQLAFTHPRRLAWAQCRIWEATALEQA